LDDAKRELDLPVEKRISEGLNATRQQHNESFQFSWILLDQLSSSELSVWDQNQRNDERAHDVVHSLGNGERQGAAKSANRSHKHQRA
jgi:hypothetical protein